MAGKKKDGKPVNKEKTVAKYLEEEEKEKEAKRKEMQKLKDEFKDDDAEMAGPEEEVDTSQSPLLQLAGWKFLLGKGDEYCPPAEKAVAKAKMLELITSKNMTSYYTAFAKALGWTVDEALVKKMAEANAAELASLEAKIEDAVKNLGETEVREGLLAKADYLALIGEKEKAVEAYDKTVEKTVASGQRIDLIFSLIRMGFSWDDQDMVRKNIAKAEQLVEAGGDWERRNRLGVYRATYLMTIREFKTAAELFLKAIATFSCYEMYSYNTFIFYTVICSLVALDRVSLRKKVVKASEILSVIHEIPHLEAFLFSLYRCKYRDFFQALSAIEPQLVRDPYISLHTGYFMREIRVVAYSQFLESYKSVTVASMSASFGVSAAFVDRELSRFIAAGRLSCKIDKVGGVVETNRPDTKNAQYGETIKEGDLLLNRIQKLTKVISY